MSQINTKLHLEEIVRRRSPVVEQWPNDIPTIGQTIEKISDQDENCDQSILQEIEEQFDTLTSDNIIEFVSKVSLNGWHQGGRPSFPALVKVLAKKIGVGEEDSSIYDAMMLCALRVEAGDAQTSHKNGYHNIQHFMDVTLMTACFIAHHNRLCDQQRIQEPKLSDERAGLALISAIIHDLDHPGKSNPSYNLVHNELQSSLKARFVLEGCGLDQDMIHVTHRTLLNTSPNLSEQDHYKMLESDIVEDADLSPSSGWGYEMWHYMSVKFTEETTVSGVGAGVDYTKPESGLWFLENIVGNKGYKSEAARDLLGIHMEGLRNKLEENLKELRKNRKT